MSGSTISLGLPLSSNAWAIPPLHIPNSENEIYKTELTIERNSEFVHKINWWYAPDTKDIRALPHNHPWAFTSKVLHGRLVEKRWTPIYDGNNIIGYGVAELIHKAGETYECPADAFHIVTEIDTGTVTEMICGPVVNNPWGYLNPETLEFIAAVSDPAFLERLWNNNTFKRPKK